MLDKHSSRRLSAIVFSEMSMRNFIALKIFPEPSERDVLAKNYARELAMLLNHFQNKRSVTCNWIET